MIKTRSFHFLWLSQAFANIGDVFYIVGIISILYGMTSSVFITSLVPFFITFSRFLGGLVAPLLIDRMSLKRILMVSQFSKTILLFLLAISMFPFQTLNMQILFLIISCISFLDGWATPARNAMLPRLVTENELMKANSFVSIVDQLIQFGGWPLAAILVAAFSGERVIFVTIITFIISTILTIFIRDQKEEKTAKTTHPSKWNSMKEGWLVIWKTPSLKTITIMDFFDSIASGVWIAAILYVYVEEILYEGEAWWGYINSTFFAGLVLGGIFVMKNEGKLKSKLHLSIIGGSIFVGIFTFWFAFPYNSLLALFLSVLLGFATEVKEISQTTIIQTATSNKYLAKVFSARDMIITSMFGISSVLLGAIAEEFGIRTVFVIAAIVSIFCGVLVYVRRNDFTKNVE
ncbi:MFS transporter [Bacillus manliponensis]|uniref:MFS transporter n=1 Tax=Bacillus manliponensis TaxID=574376 RepID=UPI000A001835|nr:MFS transporter [Bacillus manliponensis]